MILQTHKQNHLFHPRWRSEGRRGSCCLVRLLGWSWQKRMYKCFLLCSVQNHPAGLVFPVADSAEMSEFHKEHLWSDHGSALICKQEFILPVFAVWYQVTRVQWTKASWWARHLHILNCGYWRLGRSSALYVFPGLSLSVTGFMSLCSFGVLQSNQFEMLMLFLGMEKVVCSDSVNDLFC